MILGLLSWSKTSVGTQFPERRDCNCGESRERSEMEDRSAIVVAEASAVDKVKDEDPVGEGAVGGLNLDEERRS